MTMMPGCPRSKWKLKQGNPAKRIAKRSTWFILDRKLCQGLEVGTWLSDARMLPLQAKWMAIARYAATGKRTRSQQKFLKRHSPKNSRVYTGYVMLYLKANGCVC